MELTIKDTITEKISGEWGEEAAPGEGIKVIRTANFTNLGTIDYKNLVYRQINPKKVQHKKLKKGDIIIEKSGGSPDQPVGRVVFFDLDTDEEYICNNFTTILRPDSSKVHPKYLFYQLFIAHIRGRTLRYQNKTTGIINLKLDNYLNEKIIVPSRAAQSRIATILGLAEFLITQRKKSIELLDDLIKSTFLKMFGDPSKNPKEWVIKPMVEISRQITDGEHTTPTRTGSGIKLLSARNIRDGYLDFDADLDYISEAEYLRISKRCKPERNDILMSCSGSVGRVSVIDTNEALSLVRSVALIKLKLEMVDPLFLQAWMQTTHFQNQVKRGSKTSSQSNIFTGAIKKLPVILPPIELQKEFASMVEKSKELRKQYGESLSQLEMLFNSLSQKVFNGKLEYSFFDTDDTLEYEYSDNIGREEEYFPANDVKGTDIKKEPTKVKKKKEETQIKPKGKITWDKVSSQQVAEWIKEKYEGYHFSNEMLIRFLKEEHVVFPDYYSSEELKKYPQLNGADDIKSFIFSAVSNENPFIKLEQNFYNAEKETFQLNVTEEDYKLIESREPKERSGIYFSIVEQ